ncbi:hypothetical protein [Corynebacterium diphtheriae]|uniref:hypothetical protein n=1 Tax=Corynebacterium diphtheriae TaxID=1717 RepID=UPI002174D80A
MRRIVPIHHHIIFRVQSLMGLLRNLSHNVLASTPSAQLIATMMIATTIKEARLSTPPQIPTPMVMAEYTRLRRNAAGPRASVDQRDQGISQRHNRCT